MKKRMQNVSFGTQGEVYRLKRNQVWERAPVFTDKHGYPFVNTREGQVYLHRAMAYRKYGNKIFAEGVVVRHKDGDKMNWSSRNIVLGTHSENMRDIPMETRRKMNSSPRERDPQTREALKAQVFDLLKNSTMSQRDISKKTGVPRGTLHRWIQERRGNHE